MKENGVKRQKWPMDRKNINRKKYIEDKSKSCIVQIMGGIERKNRENEGEWSRRVLLLSQRQVCILKGHTGCLS